MDTARLSSQFAAQDHVCHFFATGLWYAVSREPVSEWSQRAVSFRTFPENLEIGSEQIPRAEIRVRGPARIVRDLKTSGCARRN